MWCVRMREELMARTEMEERLAEIERSLINHDAALRDIYQKIKPLLLSPSDLPKPEIGFHAIPRASA